MPPRAHEASISSPPRASWLFGGLTLLGLLTLGGCSDSTCTFDPRVPDEPVAALECGSGNVCYRGACVGSCSAGRERTQACDSDDECSGARPNCVDGFCSACPVGQQCIPLVDVCQTVGEVALPPIPEMPGPNRPRPPRPRDAGALDDGLTVDRDAGVEMPTAPRPVTNVVFVDLGQWVDLISGTRGSTIAIRSLDTTGTPADVVLRPDVVPLAIEENLRTDRSCELNRLIPNPNARPASFGRVVVDDFEGSDAFPGENVKAVWNAARSAYDVSPAPRDTPILLELSDLMSQSSTFLGVSGPGERDLTEGSWPNPSTGTHVPYALTLSLPTQTLLSSVQEIGQIPVRDLEFVWDRVGTGSFATERIIVRIPGREHEIVCRQFEGPNTPGRLAVTAGLLEDFLLADRAGPATEYPLYFERASARQLQVDPVESRKDELRHFVTVRVRHTFRGRIRF